MDRDPLLVPTPPAPRPAVGATAVMPVTVTDPTPVAGTVIVGHRRRWLRRTLWTVTALVLLGLGWFGFNFWQVRSVGSSDQRRPVDAIVVMGAAQYDGRPSPQLAARLDHVVQLWGEDLAPVVVVTGGKRPGDRFTEADASARYLEARGVPASAILMETEAHNSYDSLVGVHDLLAARGDDRVLLVSDPYHSLRIRLVAEELGFEAYVSPTRTSPVHGGQELRKELEEAAGTSLGRLIGFDRLLSITG
jgi:uncharacterized SAM-binding protein YcdF (DUF218 family)